MAGWEILTDQNGDPILLTNDALSGRRLALREGQNINNPVRSIVAGCSAFARAYNEAAIAISEWRKAGAENENRAQNAAASFERLCYKTSEYLDAYAELPKSIEALREKSASASRKEFNSVFTPCSRDWFLICNRIKHNQNMLVVGSYYFPALLNTMEIFSLFRPTGADALEVNGDLIKKGRSIPLGIAMRQMLHDVIRVDRAASKLLHSVSEEKSAPPIQNYKVTLNVRKAMQSVSKWPLWVHPEGNSMVDTFLLSDTSMKSVRVAASKRREQAKVTFSLVGDGVVRVFPII